MKRTISDLLDGVPADDIEFNEKTPLSARRIKAKALSQVGQKNRTTVRWLPRVALIAAVIMLMTLTAFAADEVLNDGALFSVFFGDTLSDDEAALVNDIGKTFGESVTSRGTTITPLRAIADETSYWLYLRVEAPEGVVLPDISEEEGYYYSFESKDNSHKILLETFDIRYNKWVEISINGGMAEALADDNPTDNVKEFVLYLSKDGTSTIFNGPWQKRLTITGLSLYQGITNDEQLLFKGTFTFDISLHNEHRDEQYIVIDTGEISFYNEEYDFTTTVTRVSLTPLQIMVDWKNTEPNNKYIFPCGGPVQIFMKDGTVVEAKGSYIDVSAQKIFHPDSIVGIGSSERLDEPIVLENIDYIVIGGEYTFDVN